MASKALKKPSASKKPSHGGKRKTAQTTDETVEQSTGVQLLMGNMPANKDAERAYETLAHLMAKAATANSHVSDQKKKMKEIGLDVKAFVDTMRLERMDPQDVAAEFRERARLMRMRGMPVQMSLYEPKYGSIDEQASAEGKAAGENGRTPDGERWPEGAPGHEAYMRSWNDAQRNLVTGADAE